MSKKKQEFWQNCEICDNFIYARHVDDHKAVCEGQDEVNSRKYCYIEDGVLHGRVQLDSGGKMIAGSGFELKDYIKRFVIK